MKETPLRYILPMFCTAVTALLLSLFSCTSDKKPGAVHGEEMFSIPYGRFYEQLNLFDLTSEGNVETHIAMQSGFFFIANGESKKIIELNSYGDILTIFYNADENVAPDFTSVSDDENAITMRKAVSYPFNTLGPIAVDSKRRVYVVDTLPENQRVHDGKLNAILGKIVVCFSGDGHYIDYIGQEGPGGTPFPFIKNIYVTSDDHLIVVCSTTEGMIVYWFSSTGYLEFSFLVKSGDIPNPFVSDELSESAFYVSIDNAIPAYGGDVLYVKADYSANYIDKDSKVLAGVDYIGTMVYPLDTATGKYGEPYVIPAFEQTVSQGFSKMTYSLPYDFLGVTSSGWLFFYITTDSGYAVQMIQCAGQRILRRTLELGNEALMYYSFSLSDTGIITGLFAGQKAAAVRWWRTDKLIDVLSKS